MTPKQKIKEYAKTLYLQIGEDGNPIESVRTLAAKVNQYIKKNPDTKPDANGRIRTVGKSTVSDWIKDWSPEMIAMKTAYAKKVEADRKAEEDKARQDREDLLGKGATTIELGRLKNQELFRKATEIIQAKMRFNEMLLTGEKPDEYSWEQVADRALGDAQLATVYKTLADKQFNYDQIIAEAAKYQDNELTVNIHVIKEEDETK